MGQLAIASGKVKSLLDEVKNMSLDAHHKDEEFRKMRHAALEKTSWWRSSPKVFAYLYWDHRGMDNKTYCSNLAHIAERLKELL